MFSIVIPFIHSKWNDQEIKFALRSVEKHLTNYEDLFIVGDRPTSLQPSSYIYIQTIPNTIKHFKERNIYMNVLAATLNSNLTENFLFMNDDHFLNSNYDLPDFPNYYGPWPQKHDQYKTTMENTKYEFRRIVKLVNNTMPEITMLDGDPEFYDIHCPMLMSKHYFKYINSFVDWDVKGGYCMKTLYGNLMHVENEKYTDLKIRQQYPEYVLQQMTEHRLWFSMDDQARGPEMLSFLNNLYPNKSKWEI